MTDMEKNDYTYSLRITGKIHNGIGVMPDVLKKEMNQALRETAARFCHRMTFNPKEWMEEGK